MPVSMGLYWLPIRHYALIRVAGSGGEQDHGILSEGLSGALMITLGHGYVPLYGHSKHIGTPHRKQTPLTLDQWSESMSVQVFVKEGKCTDGID